MIRCLEGSGVVDGLDDGVRRCSISLWEITVDPPLKLFTKDEDKSHLTPMVRQVTHEGILVVLATPIPPKKKVGGMAWDPLVAGYTEVVGSVAVAVQESLGPHDRRLGIHQMGQKSHQCPAVFPPRSDLLRRGG